MVFITLRLDSKTETPAENNHHDLENSPFQEEVKGLNHLRLENPSPDRAR